MSKAEFTKGPWILATSCSWRRIVTERGESVCEPTIQLSDNHPDLYFRNGGQDGPDARLLVSAPDLYEALELMTETFMGGGHVSDEDYALAISTASEAMAKARGE